MLQDPQTAFAVVVLGLLCAAILYVALRSPAASLQFGKMLGQQLKAAACNTRITTPRSSWAADSASCSMPKQVSIGTTS